MEDLLEPGTLIRDGQFEILKLLGKSSYSNIYTIKDLKQNKSYLMKELPCSETEEKLNECREHFLKVAESLSNLSHQSLPRLIDYFVVQNKFYYVREFIEGKTFQEIIQSAKKGFKEGQLKTWFNQLFETFGYLHSQHPPVYFGPLKPSNLLITPMGRIRIIDFGIDRFFPGAKRKEILQKTAEGFIPPEYLEGAFSEEKADIFVLGAVFYYLITGRVPGEILDFSNDVEKQRSIIEKFEPHIRKALATEPEGRFEDITDFKTFIYGEENKRVSGPVEMVISVKEIDIQNAKPHAEIQGTLHVMNAGGGFLAGRTWVDVNWISLSQQVFNGNDSNMSYTIKTANLEPGILHSGNIVLESRNLEKVIPVRLTIEPQGILRIPAAAIFLILFFFPLLFAIIVATYCSFSLLKALEFIISRAPQLDQGSVAAIYAVQLESSHSYLLRFSNFLLFFYPWSNSFIAFLFSIKLTKAMRTKFQPLYILALLVPTIWFFVLLYSGWPGLDGIKALIFSDYPSFILLKLPHLMPSFLIVSILSFLYYLSRATDSAHRFFSMKPALDYTLTTLIIIMFTAYFAYVMFALKV